MIAPTVRTRQQYTVEIAISETNPLIHTEMLTDGHPYAMNDVEQTCILFLTYITIVVKIYDIYIYLEIFEGLVFRGRQV